MAAVATVGGLVVAAVATVGGLVVATVGGLVVPTKAEVDPVGGLVVLVADGTEVAEGGLAEAETDACEALASA